MWARLSGSEVISSHRGPPLPPPVAPVQAVSVSPQGAPPVESPDQLLEVSCVGLIVHMEEKNFKGKSSAAGLWTQVLSTLEWDLEPLPRHLSPHKN